MLLLFLGFFFLLPKSPCCKVQLKSKIDLEKRLGNLKKKKEMKKLTSNSNCFVLGSYSNCIKIRLDRCVGKKTALEFLHFTPKNLNFFRTKIYFYFHFENRKYSTRLTEFSHSFSVQLNKEQANRQTANVV